MSKILKTVGAILSGIATGCSVFEQNDRDDKQPVCNGMGYATYGMAIDAVTRSNMSSFWKSSVIKTIPKKCSDPGLYSAVISIMKDDTMSDFWKNSAINDLFS